MNRTYLKIENLISLNYPVLARKLSIVVKEVLAIVFDFVQHPYICSIKDSQLTIALVSSLNVPEAKILLLPEFLKTLISYAMLLMKNFNGWPLTKIRVMLSDNRYDYKT